MKKLIEGIINFRKNLQGEYCSKFSRLASGQSPSTLFITCCDSRVVPNIFTSSDPGDLFVLRNIGNLIPPYQGEHPNNMDNSVSATLEYSLLSLEIENIVVCGHSECGAMQAVIKTAEQTSKTKAPISSLNTWLNYAASSYERLKKLLTQNDDTSCCNLLSKINVIQQLDNLKTYPIVQERLQQNKLKIHGWWFDLSTADVYQYDQKSENFIIQSGKDWQWEKLQ